MYYDEKGKIDGWSDCTESILIWDQYDDLKTTAEHVLKAFEKPVLLHVPEENDALIEMQ